MPNNSPKRGRTLSMFLAALLAGLLVSAGLANGATASGGYSRPSAASGRTPSIKSSPAPRRPSTSGGYSRPGKSSSSGGFSLSDGGAADRALARSSSRQALESFRAPAATESGGSTRRPSTRNDTHAGSRRPSRRDRSHADLDLGDLVDLARLGMLATQLWDSGSDRSAAAPATATPSASAATGGSPASPAAADPLASAATTDRAGVPPAPSSSTAASQDGDESLSFAELLTLLALLAAAGFFIHIIWRRFRGGGSGAGGERTEMFDRAKRQPYRPKWFRLGMALPVDPSLFILAAPYSGIQAPEAATASGFLSVERLGEATLDGLRWYRLYVSGGRAFFQVHLDASGHPDECRYFSLLDEVAPANQDEWGFWLDAAEGMIGWPEFQTRDGQLYRRLWAPGATRIPPRAIEETLETAPGQTERSRQQSMLYARPTGAAAPVPETEYLLISAVEQDQAAWVTLHLGVDIPVETLRLS